MSPFQTVFVGVVSWGGCQEVSTKRRKSRPSCLVISLTLTGSWCNVNSILPSDLDTVLEIWDHFAAFVAFADLEEIPNRLPQWLPMRQGDNGLRLGPLGTFTEDADGQVRELGADLVWIAVARRLVKVGLLFGHERDKEDPEGV